MRESLDQNNIESEKRPCYRLMITRHAERLPSGELSLEGIKRAKNKGEAMKDAEVLKAYASDHPSGRAYDTAENIGEQSNAISPQTGERYKTRKVKDIQYDVLEPDLSDIIPGAKLVIEEAVLNEIAKKDSNFWKLINEVATVNSVEIISKTNSKGEPMIDIEKLPEDIQKSIAPIRQKYQRLGFQKLLEKPEVVHRMSIGLAHQLVEKKNVLKEYSRKREKANKPIKGDIIPNINTHGVFTESLLKEAGIFVKPNGEEIHGINDFENEEFGGYIQPLESIYLEISDLANIPERIPITFEKGRKVKGKVFIDRQKLEDLNSDYKENRAK